MKAVIILNNNSRFLRGDVIAWGLRNYNINAISNIRIDPDNPESELLYGECIQVEFNPLERPTKQVGDDNVNIDFKEAHTWNFDTQKLELKNDSESQDLIIENCKFYAIERIKHHEKKIKKDKTVEKNEIKSKFKNGTMTEVLTEIYTIVDNVIKEKSKTRKGVL